jgi:hypothetical protein
MNKVSCLAVTTIALCMTAIPSVSAVTMNKALERLPSFMAGTTDQPLIPLEKSLLWRNKTSSETSALPAASDSTHSAANALIRGLLIANRTKEIGYTSTLSYRVQDVVRNLRRGKSLNLAGTRCRVPEPVIGRLLQLGKYSASSLN